MKLKQILFWLFVFVWLTAWFFWWWIVKGYNCQGNVPAADASCPDGFEKKEVIDNNLLECCQPVSDEPDACQAPGAVHGNEECCVLEDDCVNSNSEYSAELSFDGKTCNITLDDDIVVPLSICLEESEEVDCVPLDNWFDCINSDEFPPIEADSDLGVVLVGEECRLCPEVNWIPWDDCGDEYVSYPFCAWVTPVVDDSEEESSIEFCKDDQVRYKTWCVDCNTDFARKKCLCGIRLNTIVPFIGDCILYGNYSDDENTTVVGPTTAFPRLMWGLSKIMVTVILVFSFMLIVAAGFLMTTSGGDSARFTQGRDMILKVVVGIALLGTSGIILKLINPSFFG